MNFLEIVGMITITTIVYTICKKIYRYYFPKKYTYKNCPADHDTQSRYGAKKCDTCHTVLNDY